MTGAEFLFERIDPDGEETGVSCLVLVFLELVSDSLYGVEVLWVSSELGKACEFET